MFSAAVPSVTGSVVQLIEHATKACTLGSIPGQFTPKTYETVLTASFSLTFGGCKKKFNAQRCH